jgi:hypothetical protein
VTDRCTKAHEYVFLFSKSRQYHFDHEAIKEPIANPKTAGKSSFFGHDKDPLSLRNDVLRPFIRPDTRNKRSVWTEKAVVSIAAIRGRPYVLNFRVGGRTQKLFLNTGDL